MSEVGDWKWRNDFDFDEAVQARREDIAGLRKGSKADRRRAKVLAACRKGRRCNSDDCAVCVRRKRQKTIRRMYGLPAVAGSAGSFSPSFITYKVYINEVRVTDDRRSLDEEKVHAIAASMSLIGQRAPITVREVKKKLVLVSGAHRLEAARRLGWSTLGAWVIYDDDVEARLCQIAENVCRAELKALDRAIYINELRSLVQQKVGQVAPPGGTQPRDSGVNKTAKAMGLTREDVRRSKIIAGISAEGIAEARRLGLDDNQRALLLIAKLPTPNAQVMALQELDVRTRAALARSNPLSGVPVSKKAAAKIAGLEATIAEKTNAVATLKTEIAVAREHVHKLERKLVGARIGIAVSTPTTHSPPTAPSDHVEVTSGPDTQQPPSAQEQAEFMTLTSAWQAARPNVRERFVHQVLRPYALNDEQPQADQPQES